LDLFFKDGDDCPLVAALQPEVLTSGVNLSVSARDEMCRLFHYGRGEAWDLSLHLYLDSGRKIWRTLRQVLLWHFGDLSRVGSLLDFAAGYGRVTRFAAAEPDLPTERLWMSEIDPEAVRFQAATFGVHGLLSASDPAAFAPGREFDAILVSSLFTHLPEERFAAWLARLLALVKPGGLLAFSVHDTALLDVADVADVVDAAGDAAFVFREESESGSLDGSEYGSTWVTEAHVRARIAEAASLGGVSGVGVHRIPRGLANYQDLYVVTRGAGRAAGGEGVLAVLRGGAEGFVESCYLSAARRLALGGWVTDRFTRQPLREVRVLLDGELAATAELWDRPEIADVFPGDARGGQGWRAEVPLPPRRSLGEIDLRLVAVGADGFAVPLFAGSAESALARIALYHLLNLGRENEALKARLAGMRASRFWKIRDRWFALKRWLRVTKEA
jgi:SAM-dependent methyltransferase